MCNVCSLIAGVTIILRSVIHDMYAPFMKHTKKSGKNSETTFFTYFSFSFQPTIYIERFSRGGGLLLCLLAYCQVTGGR